MSKRRIVTVLGLSTGVFAGLVILYIWMTMPNGEDAKYIARSTHIRVQKPENTNDRIALIEIQSISYVAIDNIPRELVHALVASEDHRFFTRPSIYMVAKSLQAATYCLVKRTLKSTGVCAGNSAITQQLVKLFLVSQHRSVKRKIIELIGAIKLESQLTDDEILEQYLNRTYFGNGNYGVGMASRYYFGKVPGDLTLEECALLVGTIQNPRFDPFDHPVENRARANLVLHLMHKHGFLNQLKTIPDDYDIQAGGRQVVKAYVRHQWFWMKDEIVELFKDKPPGEYKVWTTHDPEIQIYAQTRLKNTVANSKRLRQGAVVVMRPTGEVLAMVGGTGGSVLARGTNRAVRTHGLFCPPAASTMKLVTYLTAIERGYTGDTVLDGSDFEKNGYIVGNNGTVHGDVTMDFSFRRSINTSTVRLLEEIGYRKWKSVATRLGVNIEMIRNELGIAIGQNEICLLEITSAYATVANKGHTALAHAVFGLVHMTGHVIWKQKPRFSFRGEFRQRHIKTMDHMLRGVVEDGTGILADTNVEYLAPRGKTGTADRSTSASFIGYTNSGTNNDFVVGVWLGNDTPEPIPGLTGGNAPAMLFNHLLSDIGKHTSYFPEYKGVQIAQVK